MASTRDLIARIILRLQDEASRGLDVARDRVRGVGQEINHVKQMAIGLFSIAALKQGAESLTGLSDKYAGLTGRIKQAIGPTGDLAGKQQQLFDIAQRTSVALDGTVQLYARGAQALKNLNNGQEIAAKLAETVNLSFKAQQSGAAEVASTITQLTQSISTDAVEWEDFGQLADTNLMLVNVAAKNLGYDGIGSLKQAMADGKVGNVELVNAIVSGFDEIKAAADSMPSTVAASWTKLENRLLVFVGQSKSASAAAEQIANGIGFIADHLEQFIEVSIKAGEVALAMFAGSKLKSLVIYTQEMIAARAAARALAVEQAAAGTAAGAAAGQMSIFAKAITLINKAVGALVAWEIGQTVGKWALQFEWVQYVGANVAQMTAKFVAFADFMTRPLSLESWKAFRDELGKIDVHFDGVRARIGEADSVYAESAQKVSASEQAKTQAIETEAIKQKEAFKTVQDAVKALTASIDADTKAQTAAIAQGLAERLAAIDAMNRSEAQKDTLRVAAKLEASDLELQLQQQASVAKLALIDQEYQAELAGAAKNAARTAEIENQKRQDKLAVYTGLADYYQGEVGRLSQVYATEYQAAQQAKQQLQALNQSHEQALFEVKLMGMTEREKLDAEESRFNELTRKIEAEQRKGDQADQEKIKGWLIEAKGLHDNITSAVKDSGDAQSEVRGRIDKLFKIEQKTLVDTANAHTQSAERAKQAWAETADMLEATQKTIAGITESLNKDYALKIGIDSASLTAAQSAIAALTAPAEKVITIRTVEANGKEPAAQATDAGNAPAAQATGGPAGLPTGEPWRLATGGTVGDFMRRLDGHKPLAGLLPGYGGGDKVKALLEPGEFVVRKEAVQKLGLPFMALVNAGRVPVGDVIRRALGGPVDEPNWDMINSQLFNIVQSSARLGSAGAGNIQAVASGQAQRSDSIIWKAMTTQIEDLLKRAHAPWLKDEAIDVLRLATEEFQHNGAEADMEVIKNRIKQMIDKRVAQVVPSSAKQIAALPAGKTLGEVLKSPSVGVTPFADIRAAMQQRANTFSVPMPVIPAQPVASASQSTASGNTMRVQFVSPENSKSEGVFKPSDATALLRVLKDAGARTV
ncbi:tape measure protein [Methylobacter sp.]|uniref:tape measure protein n=1 Tax=Methylobacter sp. TaxID=2051955 RepID=UPI002FDD5B46